MMMMNDDDDDDDDDIYSKLFKKIIYMETITIIVMQM